MKQKTGCLKGYLEVFGGVLLKGRFVRRHWAGGIDVGDRL